MLGRLGSARTFLAAALMAAVNPIREHFRPALRTVEPVPPEHVIRMRRRPGAVNQPKRSGSIAPTVAHERVGRGYAAPHWTLPEGFFWKQDQAGPRWRIYRVPE